MNRQQSVGEMSSADMMMDVGASGGGDDLEEGDALASDISPSEAMRLFTKIPFPEPKRVIKLRQRPEFVDRSSNHSDRVSSL